MWLESTLSIQRSTPLQWVFTLEKPNPRPAYSTCAGLAKQRNQVPVRDEIDM